jgi:non-ribosomal peptide synthetase component F
VCFPGPVNPPFRGPMPCVQELFEARASSRPSAVAVAFDDGDGSRRSLTYGEVATAADRLAGLLQKLG